VAIPHAALFFVPRRSTEPAEILMSDSKTTMPIFRRSSRCEATNCVEVATVSEGAILRNSTAPDTRLAFDTPSWSGFIAGVAAGEFDLR
jgi:hypothetical protein